MTPNSHIKQEIKDLLNKLSTSEQYQLIVEHLLGIADTTWLTISTDDKDVHHVSVKFEDGELEWEGFAE